MAATPDADRPPQSAETILPHRGSHVDAPRDEKFSPVSNASRRLRALAALTGSLSDLLTAE